MIVYLLKSMLCLLALLLIHRLLLQREVLHRFNRFFLLAAVIGSFLIPLYTIEVSEEEAPEMMLESQEAVQHSSEELGAFPVVGRGEEFDSIESGKQEIAVSAEIPKDPFPLQSVLLGVYLMISAIFLFRFLKNLTQLNTKIRRNPHVGYRNETLVLLPEVSSPFSFLKYIFVSRPTFEKEGISDAVFAHEQCHVRERHSWDVLFIEALRIPFWFHPGLYFASQAIRLNHEFIADQVALKATSVKEYQQQLLHYLNARPMQTMASSLNFSLTKKRLAMMKKKPGSPLGWLKILALVPLIGALVYFFGEKVEVQPEEVASEIQVPNEDSPVVNVETNIRIISDRVVEVDGESVPIEELAKRLDGIKGSQPVVRFSAAPGVKMGTLGDVQEILRGVEFRRVVYDSQNFGDEVSDPEKEAHYRDVYFIIEDVNMDYISKTYRQLSDSERKKLYFSSNVPAKMALSQEQLDELVNEEKYALWIDQVVVSNEKLKSYKPSDFAFLIQSSVREVARTGKFPQPYQVHLYTQQGYDQHLGKDAAFRKPLTSQDTITLTQRRVTWHKDIQKYPDANTAYLQKNARYEKLRTSGTIYIHKIPEEKALLDKLYQELESEYSQSSDKRKRSLKEPIVPSSDIPRKGDPRENSSEQPAIQSVRRAEGSDVAYTFVYSPQLHSKSLQEYLSVYGQYQTRAYENRPFSQPDNQEILEQQKLFKTLEAKYNRLSFEDRRRVKRATFPYVKLKNDGKEVFVKIEDLSPEQRKELGC
ncbi:hypothetical protein GCM10009119_24630 [Algoriphagus jejuensis]|uniref:Peptidase M56 domain-containing protein n=1 Tax=Algoriphagus jejuensis TaxID=419934 RepID=A0ABN1N1T2_9BACT